MTSPSLTEQNEALRERIRELELQLEESDETLEAIRLGNFDAIVVQAPDNHRQIYTLESADRPYRVLIEQIQEGALTVSTEGTVLYCNHRLAEMLDIPQERLIGGSLHTYVGESDKSKLTALLAEAPTGIGRGEVTLVSATGRQVPAYVSLSGLERDGATLILCGIVTDQTEQRRHIQELAQANDLLEAEIADRNRAEEALRQSQKMEAVGQLTGGLAHDFNNLLAIITGSLELLEGRINKGRFNEVARFIAASQTAAKRASSLTHRLLAFSRRQTLDPQLTDANALMTGMADLIRRTVGPEITVEIASQPDLWTTLVDPNQLENALLNLCINARDAMPDGGQIMVEATNKALDERSAKIRDLAAGEFIVLSVSDTGTGMPPEVVARVFEPFFTTKPIGQGTGLGLSMVYGFARQSDGQVRIHSEVGKGTTINIYLPRAEGIAEPAVESPTLEPLRAEEGQTVLVVDDEQNVRMLIVDVLEDLGYTAVEAHDGQTGLKVLQSDLRIDLLVTDVGMPGMNGRQLADAGRVLRPTLKVMFITGYAETAVVSHGHLEPGMAIVTKPFSLEALASRIKGLIEQ